MKQLLLLICLGAAAAARPAVADEAPPAPSQEALNAVRAACGADAKKLCAGVQPGGGRIIQCLTQHKDEVSDGCKQAVIKARQEAPRPST
jgi:Cysteine rich repeat